MQQAAEILMAEVDALVARVRSRAANAADHLERSAESVLFNIGEGVAAHKPRSKIAAYEIARREANEVRAILRRLVIGKRLSHRDCPARAQPVRRDRRDVDESDHHVGEPVAPPPEVAPADPPPGRKGKRGVVAPALAPARLSFL